MLTSQATQSNASIPSLQSHSHQPLLKNRDLVTYIQDERFSRRFEMPAESPQANPFVVTYSDFGYRDAANPESEHVLLFCSPLMGSRYLHMAKDELAKRHGVRIICPDRPGFGLTTNVEASERVQAWLKIVPALLEHLGIKHISIASHSGGSIYALNTLLYLRDLLNPTKPYVALCAPWVSPKHSSAPLMRVVSSLPSAMLNSFDSAERFLNTRITPMLGFSSGLSTGLGHSAKHKDLPSEDVDAIQFEEDLVPHILSSIHAESVQGLTSDAYVLLKRTGEHDVWGPWLDVDNFVTLLAEEETARMDSSVSPLKIEVFFASSDSMIGTGAGPKWFDNCWASDRRGEAIDYSSRFVLGTDHDNLLNLEFGVFKHILTQIPEHGP